MNAGAVAPAPRVALAGMVHSPSTEQTRALGEWQCCELAPGAAETPQALAAAAPAWLSAPVPGTVASALRAAGRSSEDDARDFDAHDYWYRCAFDLGDLGDAQRWLLRFDGLATVASVFLNGELLARGDNMFQSQTLDVSDRLRPRNELAIRFHALGPLLQQKRPRPRWKTRLVSHQNLRFFRTSLLGRMPGWSPPLAPVGPFRPVELLAQRVLGVESARIRATLDRARSTGRVELELALQMLDDGAPEAAELIVGELREPLTVAHTGSRHFTLSGAATVADARPWWPHTHGEPARYSVAVRLRCGGREVELDCGQIGFRSIELQHPTDAGFGLAVNGAPVFCRGACWTCLDAASLGGNVEEYRRALELARDAGMNMLRIGGTMLYESDTLYELCDELGILLWQDFMFANMDYPAEDPTFLASVREEASQQLSRLASRPCLAVLCGSREVEQQAAVMGVPSDGWTNPVSCELLPERIAALAPGTPYLTSTPTGGAMPFHLDAGVGHYYGVGAYLRPLSDARLSEPAFSPECLAFSNVPCDRTLYSLLADGEAPAHHPKYKRGVPRDRGAGWDFADVTDHYLEQLFDVQARALRYADMARYLELSRLVPGEVMERVIGMWRRDASRCQGALIWFYRDLWRGAGWGVIDATGTPKATYYYLKRAFAARALWFVDEGLNGLFVHACNDGQRALQAQLSFELFDDAGARLDAVAQPIALPPHTQVAVQLERAMGRFVDSTYSYRFGPPRHTVIAARLTLAGDAEPLADAFYFPLGLGRPRQTDLGLTARARPLPDGSHALTVGARLFAQAVAVDARGFEPSDNYFHLAPGATHTLRLRPLGPQTALSGKVSAVNGGASARIEIEPASPVQAAGGGGAASG